MAESPYIPNYRNLQLEILVNGTNKGMDTLLKRLKVQYELNKIPSAKLHLVSSNPQLESNDDLLKSESLAIYDEIEINVSTGKEPKCLFKGIIHKIERHAEPSAGFETKIECKDIAVNLTTQKQVETDEVFGDKMDRFLKEVGMSNAVEYESWSEELVSKSQHATPWDYLLSYLDSVGVMTTIREGIFTVVNTKEDPDDTTYLAQNGINIFELNTRHEDSVADVEIRYWNPETQSVETQESSTNVENGVGREIIDVGQSHYTSETLAIIAEARAIKNKLAADKGHVKTFGNLTAKYGEYIEFDKVNSNIDGRPLLIRSENHSIENGAWFTEYEFGLENNLSFAQQISTNAPDDYTITGQITSMQGLQIGVVTEIEGDPENEFRVRVRLTSISDSGAGVWARLSSFQASNGHGAFFVPEIDDEVIIGCINNNPDVPVILGKLYSSSRPAPYPFNDDNTIKGFVSKDNTKIIINDEDKSAEISTNNGNKLLISDAEKGFVLEDENGNKLMMNSDGITLESAMDLNLKANANINIEGTNSTLKSSAITEISGQLIKLN